MEKNKHMALKQYAKEILLKQGFKKEEIQTEHTIKINNNKYMFVDVVGIKDNKKIFIECGNLNQENKLEILKKFCDKIIHLPYLETKRKGIPFNFKIPDDLHEEFKIYSIRTKKDMRDILIEWIKKGIKDKG